jgi:lipid-A-disaccharide synthase
VRIRGYAGPAVAAAGAVLDRSIVEHAVVGFTAVVATLPTWWRLCAEALAIFREDPPDVLLTIDFPGLNLRLARWARRAGIRTVHLVAPQTWAWAPWPRDRWRP